MLIELPSKAWLQTARFNTLTTTHVVMSFCVSNLAWLTVDGRTIPGGAWGLQYRTAHSPGHLHEAYFMQPSALHLGFTKSTCASPMHSLRALASITVAHNKFPPTPTGAPFQVMRGSYSTSRALRLAGGKRSELPTAFLTESVTHVFL